MSKAQVVPPSGGGAGGMIGFEKLWEGDVTGSSDDITGGTVDPNEYLFLLVNYTGTLTNPYSDGSKFAVGIGEVKSPGQGNPTYDLLLLKNQTGAVSIGVLMTRQSAPGVANDWNIFRRITDTTVHVPSTATPFKFFGPSGQTLHFSVYGLKL